MNCSKCYGKGKLIDCTPMGDDEFDCDSCNGTGLSPESLQSFKAAQAVDDAWDLNKRAYPRNLKI